VCVAHILLPDDRQVNGGYRALRPSRPITVVAPGREPESAPYAGSGRPPASRCGEGCEFTIDPV
jgi:hypothetical protein